MELGPKQKSRDITVFIDDFRSNMFKNNQHYRAWIMKARVERYVSEIFWEIQIQRRINEDR